MLVLHGLCAGSGDLALWAESSDRPARTDGPLGRRPTAHPFAVPGAELARLLSLSAGRTVSLLLPSYASAPATSPELVRDPHTTGPSPRGRPRLRPWLVPTVTVTPAQLLALDAVPHGRIGPSAGYLVHVAEFATDLVRRGRVLPALVTGPGGHHARWLPALSGVDSTRFAVLRDAMPNAVRAEQVNPAVPDGRGPEQVLRTTLDALVDDAVRRRSAGTQLTPARGAGTATEAWLGALTGDPRFEADPVQVRQLAEHLESWHATGVRQSPVRTCFRLSSPDQAAHTEEGWRLEFLLQAVDDPSVLVPASQMWRTPDTVLSRWVDDPQELLLTDLGRASRLYPALDSALRHPHPVALDLDAHGAHHFLTQAPVLEQAGFGVLVPAWWQHPRRLGLALTANSPNTPGAVARNSEFTKQVLVDYQWSLALGDHRVTERELAELAEAKVPLVRFRGQWVHVDQGRLTAGLAFLERAGTGQMTAGHVLALQPEDTDLPLPLAGVNGRGWLGDLLSGQAERHLRPAGTPAGFTAVLRPYQQRGLAWLAFLDRLGLGACLADDMGLGKTVQLLALEVLTRAAGGRGPTLLVCPMSVVGNWQRETTRFAPGLRVHVHHGPDRLAGSTFTRAAASHDLVVTTYTLATRDSAVLSEIDWDRLVLDEAQNIKNTGTRQSRAIRRIPARHRVALTGTPVENRLAELWSIMDFANPGVLGTANTFRARFAVPIERHDDQEAAARLRRVTGPFVLRRLKTDPRVIDDLPEKIEMKPLCNLTIEQASLYRAVVDDMLDRVERSEGLSRKGLVLATMSKLKQVCNHPAQLLGDGSPVAGRSGKVARLEEILEEVLADGDKALCFTQFTEFGGMLVPHLATRFDTEVLYLHGETSRTARDRMVERFQSPDGPSIFLLSLRAGGTGLNLTAANHVIHLDRWWNPAVEDQATDRAFRIGQRQRVQVRKLICIGTLEEKVDRMIEEKRTLARLAVGVGESWLTDLSTGQLRELVTLSPEAVSE